METAGSSESGMEVEIAIDAMVMAPWIGRIVPIPGDGDFPPLAEAVQREGLRVGAVSALRSSPPLAIDKLRLRADGFIEIA